MTPELRQQMRLTIGTSGKIAAIKLIRAEMGQALKEAKDIVEALDSPHA